MLDEDIGQHRNMVGHRCSVAVTQRGSGVAFDETLVGDVRADVDVDSNALHAPVAAAIPRAAWASLRRTVHSDDRIRVRTARCSATTRVMNATT